MDRNTSFRSKVNQRGGVPDVPADRTTIRPFSIDIPQSQLDDLKDRLEAPLADSCPATATTACARPPCALADHWRTSYDWRSLEARLNAYPSSRR